MKMKSPLPEFVSFSTQALAETVIVNLKRDNPNLKIHFRALSDPAAYLDGANRPATYKFLVSGEVVLFSEVLHQGHPQVHDYRSAIEVFYEKVEPIMVGNFRVFEQRDGVAVDGITIPWATIKKLLELKGSKPGRRLRKPLPSAVTFWTGAAGCRIVELLEGEFPGQIHMDERCLAKTLADIRFPDEVGPCTLTFGPDGEALIKRFVTEDAPRVNNYVEAANLFYEPEIKIGPHLVEVKEGGLQVGCTFASWEVIEKVAALEPKSS